MSLGIGEGAELQAPLARVVIGGLTASTLVTLVLVPAVYTLFEEGLTGLRRGAAHVTPGASLDDHEKAGRDSHSSRGRGRRRAGTTSGTASPSRSRRSSTRSDLAGRHRRGVKSTGTLEPLGACDVGSQVSGVVQEIYVDFNHIVKKDQFIAEIDPSLLQVQVDIQEANIERQKSDIDSQEVQLEDQKKQSRAHAKRCSTSGLQNQQQLEAGRAGGQDSRGADRRRPRRVCSSAEANLNSGEAERELHEDHSPIDGVVVDRSVDVGQTVQSSMNVAAVLRARDRPARAEAHGRRGRGGDRPDPGRAWQSVHGRRLRPAGLRRHGRRRAPERDQPATTS